MPGGRPAAGLNGQKWLRYSGIEDLSQVRVSTAPRHLEDPRKAPTAVAIISGEEITCYGGRTLGELLRSVTESTEAS